MQSDLLDGLDSRVAIPQRRVGHFPKVKLSTLLTPVFSVAGEDRLFETPKTGAVPQRILRSPVASLADRPSEITAALDFLLKGSGVLLFIRTNSGVPHASADDGLAVTVHGCPASRERAPSRHSIPFGRRVWSFAFPCPAEAQRRWRRKKAPP